MWNKFKRVISFMLAVILCLTQSITALADAEIGADPPPTINKPTNNPNYNASTKHPTFKAYGFRITMTSPQPIFDANVPILGDTYTMQDVEDQRNLIADISNTRYWMPGNNGINLYTGNIAGWAPNNQYVYSATDILYSTRPSIKVTNESMPVENPVAWMIWNSEGITDRTENRPNYYQPLYEKVFDQAGAGNPDQWFADMRAIYNSGLAQAGSMGSCVADPKTFITQLIGKGGRYLPQNFQRATWDTDSPASETNDPYLKVQWSRMGHLAMCIMLTWAAQDIGDVTAYQTYSKITANWVATGMNDQHMPIIMIEATVDHNYLGDTSGPDYFSTLPAMLQTSFLGNAVADKLYTKWPDDCYGDIEKAILWATNGLTPQGSGAAFLMHGLGWYPSNGVKMPATGSYASDPRAYFKLIGPQTDITKNYSYFVAWTYASNGTPPPDNDTNNQSAMGSFTWKLTPDGVHDKTPAKEVNESSTIYELNISQDKYNANNYQKWNSVVRGDGVDCNKLRIRIYHVSENLAEEQMATKYARDAVKQKGAEVTAPINKVTVSPSGNITGFPAGTLTQLHNNTWSENLTDDQFLKIMKEATGLTYSETVAGRLVNGSTPEGVRVTYAVYVDYDIGCKDTGEKYQLSNDQAEWVEYRSIPGTYVFQSGAPEGGNIENNQARKDK